MLGYYSLVKCLRLRLGFWIKTMNEIDIKNEHDTLFGLTEHLFEFILGIILNSNGNDGDHGDTSKHILMELMEIFVVRYAFTNQ